MQIKYRITVAYTVILTAILLLFSITIYLSSYYNRLSSYKQRLRSNAESTMALLKNTKLSARQIYNVNSSSDAFEQHSVYVFDYRGDKDFKFNAGNTPAFEVTDNIIAQATKGRPYYFEVGDRDAIAIEYKDRQQNYIVVVAGYDAERASWQKRLQVILGVSLLISILIVVFAGYIFSLSLIRALTEFTHKIKHISSEKFSLRLDTGKGKDELQKLAITINDLLDRLQASFNLQRRFIDNASHELSTPLASIASQMDVALQRERTSEEYKKALLSINDDVKRLSMLVRSLLEIAKVSGSMGGTELTSVRIDELLMKLPADLKKISPMYDVNIEFDQMPEDESSLIIYGNEHLLFSSIKNIVHNACKFSEDKKSDVRMSFTDDDIVISIQDKGPGIDEHDLKNIFQPFYRSNRHQSYVSGAGLGLSLAQRIIGLHKGAIDVTSEIGVGTRFIISLPIEKVVEPDGLKAKGK